VTMRWFSRATPGLPFADRDEAGRRLAEHLARRDEASLRPAEAVVLGIPRGGVPVAAAIARTLGLPLDVIVAHKLGAPGEPELAIGAVAADGTVLIEPWSRGIVGDDEAYLRRSADDEIARARRREVALRRGRPALDLHGRTAIIVDDGIATGATMHVAVLAARAAGASRVIVASPVGASESVATLRAVADEVVVLATPEPFFAVGEFYVRFDQTGDDEVAALLADGARTVGEGAPGPDGAEEPAR
jgi:putative phosphoribosyl transferase